MTERYRHTQTGWVIIGAVLAAGGFITSSLGAHLPVIAAVVAAGFALVIALFGWLRVTITDEAIEARMGIGLFGQKVPLDDVRSFRLVRNSWLLGWGIRFYPGGTLYNVAGLDALEVILTDDRRFRFGTDEPQALYDAMVRAKGEPAPLTAEEEARLAKRKGRSLAIAIAIAVVVFAGVIILLWGEHRPPRVRVEGGAIRIETFIYDHEVPLADVTEVALREDLPRINARTNGYALGGTLRGHFDVQGLGRGRLYIERDHPPFVLIRTKDSYVVLGYEDPAETRALFERIRAAR